MKKKRWKKMTGAFDLRSPFFNNHNKKKCGLVNPLTAACKQFGFSARPSARRWTGGGDLAVLGFFFLDRRQLTAKINLGCRSASGGQRGQRSALC